MPFSAFPELHSSDWEGFRVILEKQSIFSLSVPEGRLPAFCFNQKLAFYMTYLVKQNNNHAGQIYVSPEKNWAFYLLNTAKLPVIQLCDDTVL